MFTLISRVAGEQASAYRTRYQIALAEFESQHNKFTEREIADGILLVAPGWKLYLSYRGL